MKGSYNGISKTLSITSGILCFIVIPLVSAFISELTCLIATAFSTLAGYAVSRFAVNVPCRWSVEDKGFTITMLGLEDSFRYDDIGEISCRYEKNETETAIARLTITDRSGLEHIFSENCNVTTAELLNDPDSSKQPQLFRLCGLVKQEMEARS